MDGTVSGAAGAPVNADSNLIVVDEFSLFEAVGEATAVVAVEGCSNLEALEDFSRDETVEKAVPEATAAEVVSDFEVIKEAVGGDP